MAVQISVPALTVPVLRKAPETGPGGPGPGGGGPEPPAASSTGLALVVGLALVALSSGGKRRRK